MFLEQPIQMVPCIVTKHKNGTTSVYHMDKKAVKAAQILARQLSSIYKDKNISFQMIKENAGTW